MTVELTTHNGPDYTVVKILQTLVPEVARTVLASMAKVQREIDQSCFLVDVRNVRASTSAVDEYRIATNIYEEVGLDRQTKVALLRQPYDISYRYTEIIGQYAGNNIVLFDKEQEAIDWLTGA